MRTSLRLSLLLAFAFLASLARPAMAMEQKQVLVLYSTARETEGSIVGERELPSRLAEGLDGQVNYYSEFIDQGRIRVAGYRVGFRDFLKVKYAGQQFDLVIALQDPAAEFIQEYRDELFPSAPVVFFGYAAVPRIRNSTGLTGGLNLAGTLALATALQPDLEQVFLISGAGARDKAFEEQARQALRPYEARLKFTYLSGLTSDELTARVSQLPARSAVYFLLVYQDASGERTLPLRYLDQVTASAVAPTYCWVDSAMDHGIVGGALQEQKQVMDAVARLGLRVLGGTSADDIPVSPLDPARPQVDWRQLRRWNISESRVPAGTIVRFRTPGAWEEYRPYILAVLGLVAAQTALIAGLLIQASRRRQAERRLKQSQAMLQASYSQLADAGGRILHAQELERSRIARELHDDFGQQMAVLAVELQSLENGACGGAERTRQFANAHERLQGLAKAVHDLSHRLHPERLRLLGLVAALEGLIREQRHPGVSVTFSHDSVPAELDERISLCLYRVAQEALQNALKYSEATTISIDVRADTSGVHLTILDDGKGFDVEGALGSGLGLISMQERIESARGLLTIRATTATGTAVRAWLPLLPDAGDRTPPSARRTRLSATPSAAAVPGSRRVVSR